LFTGLLNFFYFISKLAANDEDGLKDLHQLLQASHLEYAIRVGDVFSMIIEFQANKLRWKQVCRHGMTGFNTG
jgi:hypothetical protein